MPEIVALILADPAVRAFIEELALKIFAEFMHRRSVDPAFLAKSDAVFATFSNAKNDQEAQSALKAIQQLRNNSPAGPPGPSGPPTPPASA